MVPSSLRALVSRSPAYTWMRLSSAMLLFLQLVGTDRNRLPRQPHLACQERDNRAAAQWMRRRLPARERVGQRDRTGGLVAGAELTHPLVLSGDHRFAGHLVGPVGLHRG